MVAKELTQERDEALAERDQKIDKLREIVIDLQGRVEVLVQLLAKSGDADKVIDLPSWRRHG